jgi:DNA-binding NtrC family response regulator
MAQPNLPLGVIVTERYTSAREALADLLRSDGFRAFEADDATALFAINTNPDAAVLLMDLDIMNWKTIVDYAQTRIPGIFVIGMHGTDPVPSNLEQCGVSVCFKKPLMYSAIAGAISAVSPPPVQPAQDFFRRNR